MVKSSSIVIIVGIFILMAAVTGLGNWGGSLRSGARSSDWVWKATGYDGDKKTYGWVKA